MVGPCLAGSVDWELDADDCCTLWSNPRRGANEVSPSRGFGARPPPPVPVAPRMPPSRGFRTRSSARRSANEALLFVAPRRLASRGSTAWPPPSELASPRRALGSRTGSVLWPNPSSPSLPGRRTGTPRCSNPFSPEFSLGWLPLAFSSSFFWTSLLTLYCKLQTSSSSSWLSSRSDAVDTGRLRDCSWLDPWGRSSLCFTPTFHIHCAKIVIPTTIRV